MSPRLVAFLRQFLPVALLIVVGAYWVVDGQRKLHRAEARADQSLGVSLAASAFGQRAQVVARDLHQLAAYSGIQQLRGRSARPDLARLEKSFLDLIDSQPFFDRVRWIDVDGQEIIRVDAQAGQGRVTPKELLQNEAGRDYFSEAMRQPPGRVHVSPIDPNAERGRIETPYKPVLRLAMLMADAQGNRRGLLIVDYLCGEIFDSVKALASRAADRPMLVDAAGHFLLAPDPADASGLTSDDAARTLAARFPESWARMRHEGGGQFVDRDGLWTFQTVPAPDDSNQWLVLTRLSADRLAALAGMGGVGIYLFAALLLGLFAAGAYALARVSARESEAERRFKVYFECATVGMAMVLPNKRWLAVNPAFCRMLGYSAEALLNKRWDELTHPDDLATSEAEFDRALRGEHEGYEKNKRYIHANGEALDVSISTQLVRKRDGRPDYFLLVVEDISQRLRAERQRQQSLEVLRRFIDHLPGLAYIKDHQARILVASRKFEEMLGLKPEAVVGKRTEEVFPGEAGAHFVADDLRILASGRAEQFEERYGERVYETIKFPIRHDEGPLELGGITIDITARKAAEQMLALQARRATALLALPQKSIELDEPAFMEFVLGVAKELTGSQIGFMYFVRAADGDSELVACATDVRQGPAMALAETGAWGDAVRLKEPVVINDGPAAENAGGLPAGCSAFSRLISVPIVEGACVRMLMGVGNKPVAYTDTDVETLQLLGNEAWRIIRQRRVEKALLIANQVVNASPVICFRWAASDGWPVIFVSENVVRWGYTPEELRAGNPQFAELIHPDDLARIGEEVAMKSAAGCTEYEQEYRIITRENQPVWVVDRTIVRRDADGAVAYYEGVLTDITERKTQQLALAENLAEQKKLNKLLEEAHNQLLQSEKMASIGQLAAGVAHELNNPIGFVHSNLGTLDGYLRDLMDIIDAYDALAATLADDPRYAKIALLKDERDFAYIREDVGQLLLESKDGLSRVRKIVQDLKSFSHVGEQEWQWADLHQGLNSTLNIVWNELKYKCKVIKEYGELPQVFCMISQLNQVFMNLLVNAGHAIEQQGTITIRTRCCGEDEVCIEVIDTGKGIAPEFLSRVFEPFFTTKPVGKGTGLGLSLSYGIVGKHHGHIEVDSTVGQGTTFRVILPINQGTAVTGATAEAIA